jgi:hypothetical protein
MLQVSQVRPTRALSRRESINCTFVQVAVMWGGTLYTREAPSRQLAGSLPMILFHGSYRLKSFGV